MRKQRVGLIMLGAGLVLVAVFFILYNPNAVLREEVREAAPRDTMSTVGTAADSARVTAFLSAYNRQYAPLDTRWRTLVAQSLADSNLADRYQVAAARRALLTFAGHPDNLASIRKFFPLLTLPELQDRQIAVARRLAALRPGDLPAPLLEILDGPVSDPYDLPAAFRARNRAARSLGYESYLGLMADDLALDREHWSRVLKSLLEQDAPLADQVRHTGQAAVPGAATPAPEEASQAAALAFWQELDLPPLSSAHQPVALTLEGVIQAQTVQACEDAGLPPVLRGPACRAFGRALVHLAQLGARSAGRRSLTDAQLAQALRREAAAGPVMRIPLYTGAYLDWLEQMDRGLVAQPMVLDRYKTLVAEQAARWAPDREPSAAPATLPAAAYAPGTGPVAPLDDILGWAIAHQLHRYICTRLLDGDAHRADYRHDHRVGDFLLSILRQGRGSDWQVILRQTTGEDFDPRAMISYYRPPENVPSSR